MDVQVTSTNRKFYNLPSDISALLLDAFPDTFTRVVREPLPQAVGQPPIPPKAPVWSAGFGRYGGPAVFLSLPNGEVVESHEVPDVMEKSSFRMFQGKKLRVPKDVIETYRRLWRQSTAPVR